ncbi:ribosomal protein L29 [Cryptosporidium parvum Iowa II]|uniref:60S ribosomal protein L29 n=1 Tax=Cryptosporidium parvum (strain Iowa II) TaxID=353152 RepID=A3FQR0_CRYPI|nr:ribosomal protein L29 [Cryptosporidium parvum Iowa II]EAZ51211.1 ribosomal protein L29 [Cryptosporidium parvum Iowa II]
MAKSKNHTNHNQVNRKAHRNGIKKAKSYRKLPTFGMNAKFLKNQRFCKKVAMKEAAAKAAAAKKALFN